MNPIGIDFISVFGQPPVDFVHVVADLGLRHMGIAPAPVVTIPGFYPPWSLTEDTALRRAFAAAVKERGITITLAEGFLVWPDRDIGERAADIDTMAELGAPMLNACSLDPDHARAFDQLGAFAEMAAARGMRSTIEFGPPMAISDLPTALAAVRHVGRADFSVLVDAMHLYRSGAGAADLAALAPGLIGYVQLCDVPLVSPYENYGEEACYDRRIPGEGELPLRDMVAALPPDMLLGLEVPMRARAESGQDPRDYLRPAVEAAQRLVERAHA